MKKEILCKLIDHTLLKPNASEVEVVKLCKEAIEHNFMSVCINPCYIRVAKNILKDTDVKVCTVVGFPLGSNTRESKLFETEDAINKGAEEIDMVINISKLKNRDYKYVEGEIEDICNICHKNNVITKVIIETCLLTLEEKIEACKISKNVGADFVKTSTGFSSGGATKEDIKLMRETVGDNIGVKASGAVRNYKDAIAMIENGATRIGASSSVTILNDAE
ncbi:MAG: deoxyribose-phosphate aldolase [Clostridium sp.]